MRLSPRNQPSPFGFPHNTVDDIPFSAKIRDPLPVTLNLFEMRFAQVVGEMRQSRRERAGDKNAHGSKGGVEDHILGAQGELAFAKVLKRYPSGLFLSMQQDDDVGGIQIRTRRSHYMDLYLWKRDDKEQYYALMTGTGPKFVFQGFIYGAEGAVAEYWREGREGGFPRTSCWVIPAANLSTDLFRLREMV